MTTNIITGEKKVPTGAPVSAKDVAQAVRRQSIVDTDTSADHSDEQSVDSAFSPFTRLSFDVGVTENKNSRYRQSMEDVHTYVANFAERLDWGYFAVFDGHAGKQTARWCGSNLHNILYDNIVSNEKGDLRDNLCEAFEEADSRIGQLNIAGSSGCTAAVAVLRWEEEIEEGEEGAETNREVPTPSSEAPPFDFVPTKCHKRMLYTANVGDSRVVVSRGGKAKRLSYDHKSTDRWEQQRIVKNGGIMLKSRVNGVLAVTRSLGDCYMKSLVVGAPYTTATELQKGDELVILACDGLWDVCSDQQAVDMIREVQDPKRASSILCDYALKQMTTDNVTVMVVRLDTRVFQYR